MAIKSSTAGIVLLLVSVLGVAAIGGALCFNYHDADNPNGVLGVYTVVEYTQGGIGPDGEWHWYETGDGMYDGETIILEEYKDGFIKGWALLNNEKYLLNGYYNPKTNDFGYTSYYDFTPESGDDVVDVLYGSIKDDVMILTGYTISTKNATQAFAFNFIFTKNGAPYVNPFKDTDFGTFKTDTKVVLDASTSRETEVTGDYSYKELEYRNGVYKLEINGGIAAAVTTMNMDKGGLIVGTLRCVHIEDDHICTEWIVISNTFMYSFACDSWDSSSSEFIKCNKQMTTLPKFTVDKNAVLTVKSSLDSEIHKYQYKFSFNTANFFDNSHSIVVKNNVTGKNFIINVWGSAHVSCMYHTTIDGVEYYGELFGMVVNPGTGVLNFNMTGFLISTTGETLVVNSVF